ncbi:hypothetical protein WN55_09003 [Dufourea novaeangliae]|uniref:Uncharacterized protein n=1 Tax=Dufourea novaeangliae TaxID=178035 RepID=A0A154P669_DUFNO|nr:hypothetical protein WN55_09003 [Dufourea novaeangliae]
MGNYLGVEEALSEKFCQSVSNRATEMFSSREYYAMLWWYVQNHGDVGAAVQVFGYDKHLIN